MALQPFQVRFKEGNATAELVPRFERRDVTDPSGTEKQVQHRVPFRVTFPNGETGLRWLVILDSTVEAMRAKDGTSILDDQGLLRRLFAQRFEGVPSSLAELPVMEISVRGARTSIAHWQAVRDLRDEQLPDLTSEQKETARQLKIREADYARSALAAARGVDDLVAKTRRIAKFLERQARARDVTARIERITLDTLGGSFEVELRTDREVLPLRIDEGVVDDLFERGSPEAEQRLSRIVDLALQT